MKSVGDNCLQLAMGLVVFLGMTIHGFTGEEICLHGTYQWQGSKHKMPVELRMHPEGRGVQGKIIYKGKLLFAPAMQGATVHLKLDPKSRRLVMTESEPDHEGYLINGRYEGMVAPSWTWMRATWTGGNGKQGRLELTQGRLQAQPDPQEMYRARLGNRLHPYWIEEVRRYKGEKEASSVNATISLNHNGTLRDVKFHDATSKFDALQTITRKAVGNMFKKKPFPMDASFTNGKNAVEFEFTFSLVP